MPPAYGKEWSALRIDSIPVRVRPLRAAIPDAFDLGQGPPIRRLRAYGGSRGGAGGRLLFLARERGKRGRQSGERDNGDSGKLHDGFLSLGWALRIGVIQCLRTRKSRVCRNDCNRLRLKRADG